MLAFLSLLPFESFEDKNEKGMVAFIPEKELTASVREEMEYYITKYEANYEEEIIYPKNWNAEWEASFKPVEINSFCRIRADFHDKKVGFDHEIVINPKMAFGTGHHETTFMMVKQMETLNFNGKTVFDYGCGTGVLAILASKLGASFIAALDIEPDSYENTIENCKVNHINNVQTYCGTLSEIEQANFDIILANINRQVLIDSATGLYKKLMNGGDLLISGILLEDQGLIQITFKKVGFKIKSVDGRGKWLCIHLTK